VGDRVGARRRWKRPFDNHLEGSSIKRYSEVAEAMTTYGITRLRRQEMPLYGGIDLHANNSVVVLLNEQDQVIYQRRFANHLPTILEQLAPYQADIKGVVVESTYNWYWTASVYCRRVPALINLSLLEDASPLPPTRA
jgi:hypothetical protein